MPDTNPGDYPASSFVDVGGNDHLAASYTRFENLPQGVVIKVQLSNDLTDWSAEHVVIADTPSTGVTITIGPPAGGERTITVRQNTAMGEAGAYKFMRFAMEQG